MAKSKQERCLICGKLFTHLTLSMAIEGYQKVTYGNGHAHAKCKQMERDNGEKCR